MFERLHDDSSDELSQDSTIDASLEKMVELAQSGDRKAFEALFEVYNNPICTYLSRLVGDELSQDLAQETFLRVWNGLPNKRHEVPFKSWLYCIATNVAKSYLRHARLIRWLPLKDHESCSNANYSSAAGSEEHVDRMDEEKLIKATLAKLPPQQRTCLLLNVIADFTESEIAEILGIKKNSVSGNVSRGRKLFCQIYQRLKGDLI